MDDLTFYINVQGIQRLLDLKPDIVAMEPSGIHYSWLLSHVCQSEGIKVFWVGHTESVHYCKQNRLPDKNDLADALAIAAYTFTYLDKPEYFLQFEPGLITRLRELYLQLQSLNRIQSPVINRARQQLAREFPEAALKNSPQGRDGLSPLWAWLAHWQREQVRNNHYYDRLYQGSLAPKYQVEISDFTRNLARLLCQIHLWERDIEREWVLDKISIKSQRPSTPVGQRLSAYYDLKASQFTEDPNLAKEKVLSREKRRLKLNFQESLHSSFGELLTKEQFQVISQRLDTKFFEDVLEINQTQKMVKQGLARKGFGVLVINQVVAYACKLLFQEIKRNLLDLD